MAGNLTDEERKWILKQYWKTENSEHVRKQWRETFATAPPTRLTIYRIRDKFDQTGSIHNAPKSGRPVSVTTPENAMQVAQAFIQDPQKSKNKASSELGIERRSLGRLMRHVGVKISTDEPEVKRSTMPKTIGTHNGSFHCDEALACYLLQLLPEYKDSTIVRTRDNSKLDECDIVVDVGGVYDEKRLKFDHHQRTFNESMNSLNPNFKWVTKLSSAGLIYYHYGRRIIEQILESNSKDAAIVDIIFEKVYENFVEEIDGIDNGINQTEEKPKYCISTSVSKRVSRLNPRWNQDDFDEEELFRKAMKLVGNEFVERILFYKESWIPAREVVLNALKDRQKVHESNEILVLTTGSCPWKDHLIRLEEEKEISPSIKYVLFSDQASNWRVQCVPVHAEGFTNRLSLPEEWCGLRDEELSEKSGIKGCIFVHATGFIGGNKTYDGALEMAKMALKNKKED